MNKRLGALIALVLLVSSGVGSAAATSSSAIPGPCQTQTEGLSAAGASRPAD